MKTNIYKNLEVQYNKLIEQGYSDFMARKKVLELLGHHRDDVTRIYLSGGDDV